MRQAAFSRAIVGAGRPSTSGPGSEASASLKPPVGMPFRQSRGGSSLMCRVKRFSPLKTRAVLLAGRKGFNKAVVAAARKSAVLMLALWKNGTGFNWTKEACA